ncbi:MFS transporter (plasmid) [Leptolyngbya sp. BL0902]|uniref:MFS transporter n=1 Tax=Leptolyngbya sp. BL0902 TaxID=1115757 RepID=UPI0018E72738|nr:MFS transporter [Leptolyngbya sp. BL0902]QQE67560.1 MFS transporter [Leptolyngbya sp. BL0902]
MTATVSSASFEQRLDNASLTRAMGLLWLLSAGLIALDGFDFFVIGVALPFLKRDFGLDAVTVGAVATAAVVGSLVGSLTLGPITDRVGRKPMLIVDVALFVVATAGTALAWNAASLIAFRFLVGVAIGADYPISVAYITENVPARYRGRLVIGAFTFQAVGAMAGALTGVAIIYLFQVIYPDPEPMAVQYAWRWMLGVGVFLAVIVAAVRLAVQLESPRYHISRGEYAEASAAASQLLGEPITLTAEDEPLPETESATFATLFAPTHRRSTLLASLPWFLQDIATYGIGIFTPVIIAKLAFATETDFLVREMNAAQGAALVDVFLIVGFLSAVFLVERWGRMRLQIVGFIGMAIGLLLLATSGLVVSGSGVETALVLAGFLVFNLMMNAGPNATTFLLSGEVFPTHLRATGAGFAAAFAKAGAVLGTFVLPIFAKSWGIPPLLVGLAIICILAALITYRFRIETTGQSLEAVQDWERSQVIAQSTPSRNLSPQGD